MKTTPSRTAVAALGAAGLVLSLAACGGLSLGGSDDAKEPEVGPLEKYFEQMYGGEFNREDANAQQIEVEEITAACMRELGFEYTPVDYSSMGDGGVIGGDFELEEEWGTLEFAKKWGYGATTNPWGETTSEPVPDDGGQEWVDPNQEYVEAMSETERNAYYAALYGEQTFDENSEEEEFVYDWEQAGCSGRAQHEVYEEGNGMEEDEFTALQEEMNAMWEASMADPRLSALNSEWSSCMADAGYPGLAAIGDAETVIYDKVNALWEDAYSGMDGTEEWTEEDYRAQEEAIQEELAAITPEEIETAVADFTCREDVKYDVVQREVNFEYQQEFVDTHKEELEAWVASVEAKG